MVIYSRSDSLFSLHHSPAASLLLSLPGEVGGRHTHSPEALNLGLGTWRPTVVTGRKDPVCVVYSLLTHLSRAEFMTDPARPWDETREKKKSSLLSKAPRCAGVLAWSSRHQSGDAPTSAW